MLESIEGKRGLPRHKPPFPARSACSAGRRSINNVETLYWVRDIVEKGPEWFAAQGRNGRKGLRTLLGLGPGARTRASSSRRPGSRSAS